MAVPLRIGSVGRWRSFAPLILLREACACVRAYYTVERVEDDVVRSVALLSKEMASESHKKRKRQRLATPKYNSYFRAVNKQPLSSA